ncbi:MAG: hypothetical protein RL021_1955 [Bacteroidota bacterium]|jgi:signal transduction histidine kinase
MRPVTILYILFTYVILQFCWWAYLLTSLNDDIYRQKTELLLLQSPPSAEVSAEILQLEEKLEHRKLMILGEGLVFLSLLVWGSFVTLRSFRRDLELVRLQQNFLLSVTHEFKTPLASIKLYLETISRHGLDKEKQQQFIRNALVDTERLNNLVENVLMANLFDHDKHFFAEEKVDLSNLLEEIRFDFERIPSHPALKFDVEENISVIGDPRALSTLVNNLLENAVKYSPGGTPIGLLLRRTDKEAELNVIDSGIGIPEEEKQLVFRKFYRSGDELTRSTKGTGLGLFLVKYITDKHKGTVSISDNTPKGTVFSVRLPLSAD